MASNTRKKVFPKAPVKFHSSLAHELGRWSNKNGFDASVKAIYTQERKDINPKLSEKQARQLDKLKQGLARRKDEINYDW